MAQPLYNGFPLFSGEDYLGNVITEGVLQVGVFDAVLQPIHFEGENGTRMLAHGFDNLKWEFNGMMSAPSIALLDNDWNLIQTEIQNFANQPSTYFKTLVDSWGNSWSNAAITRCSKPFIHYAGEGNYTSTLKVEGFIVGMQMDSLP